jgi:hypothetical protein
MEIAGSCRFLFLSVGKIHYAFVMLFLLSYLCSPQKFNIWTQNRKQSYVIVYEKKASLCVDDEFGVLCVVAV